MFDFRRSLLILSIKHARVGYWSWYRGFWKKILKRKNFENFLFAFKKKKIFSL
jgi:hypothetical protein